MSDDIWNGRPPLGPPEATDPTADAAKLLPSEAEVKWLVSMQGTIEAGKTIERLYRLAKENTRPQPAPPAGEPDFAALSEELWMRGYLREAISIRTQLDLLAETLGRMYRLGLAAQPKVEDAEVAALCSAMRRPRSTELEKKAANLLERLSGENAELADLIKENILSIQSAEAHVKASEVRRAEYLQRAEDAESKLAEREAELAMAEDILYAIHCEEGDFVYLKIEAQEFVRRATTKAKERHAARQQQKAPAEPTAREGE